MGEGKQIRWGILSTAKIGKSALLPAINAAGNAVVQAVSSRSQESAERFAEENNIPQAFGDYESMLRSDQIDAVYNPLPNNMHKEWSIKAAQYGKHVLCEKPITLNAAECLDLITARDQYQVKMMEGFMYRFHPAFIKLKELLRSGAIGELNYIQAAFTFVLSDPGNIRLLPELGGGGLMDVGCYCVNVIRSLAGEEPESVHALAHISESGVDEHLVGTLKFKSGLIAQFDSGFITRQRQRCRIAGDLGSLEIRNNFTPGTREMRIHQYDGYDLKQLYKIEPVDQYQLMIEHFSECVLKDMPLRYPLEEACANMRVIDALYSSVEQREMVKLT